MKLFKGKKKNAQKITHKNAPLLQQIVSQSGISWNELYYVNENKYFTCFQIIEFPESSSVNMFEYINELGYAFVAVDYKHIHEAEFTNEGDNIHESSSKGRQDAKTLSQYRKASKNSSEFKLFTEYIEDSKNSVKTVTVRIFVFGKTNKELQENSEKIENTLYKGKMRGYIQTNNLLEDYQSHLMHSNPIEQFVSSGNLADMTLSSNINIIDDNSALLGTTGTGVYAPNPFSFRNYSYNIVFMGGMGAGKSALIKKLLKNLLIRGNYVPFIIDIHDEYDFFCQVLGIERVSFGSDKHINLMEMYSVDNDKGDAIIRENDIQTKITNVTETYRSFTAIKDREQTILVLQKFLSDFYSNYKGRDFTTLDPEDWGRLSDVLIKVEEEIEKINVNGDTSKVVNEYLKDLYNIQIGLSNMCENYGYLFNEITNIEFDLTQPICFDIGFLKNDRNANLKAAYVSLIMNYASYGAYLNQKKNEEKCRELGIVMNSRKEPFYTHHVVIDEFMQYAESRAFLMDTISLVKYMRKAYSGLLIVVHTTDDTQKSMEYAGDLLSQLFSLCTTKYIGRTEYDSARNLPVLLNNSINMNDAISISKFRQGINGERKFLAIDGQDRKLYFTSIVTPREVSYFKGGV